MEILSWALAKSHVSRGHHVEFLTTRIPGIAPRTVVDGITVQAPRLRQRRIFKIVVAKVAVSLPATYAKRVDLVMGIGGGAHGILDACMRTGCRTPVVLQSHGTPWGKSSPNSPFARLFPGRGRCETFPICCATGGLSLLGNVSIGPAVDQALRRRPMSRLVRNTPITMIENGVHEAQFRFDPVARNRLRERLGLVRLLRPSYR